MPVQTAQANGKIAFNVLGDRAMIKDVIVALSAREERDPAADYAISFADFLGAHVAGVAFAFEPVVPATVMGGIPADLIEMQRAESEKAARAAVTRFDKVAVAAGLSTETHFFNVSVGGAADLFGRLTRRFDLSVVSQADPDRVGPEELITEAALFESGRPVIVVPYIQQQAFSLNRVLVCWDGSRAAARAVGDAIPLLERAKDVHVLIAAGERRKRDEVPGADIGQHLARHGVKIEVHRAAATDIDIADLILSYAADLSADFMVMGAYGHSRLREFVLGGVTRGILASMTVPALMSH
jgi:nucleotide-binding universal stress UspA family protein